MSSRLPLNNWVHYPDAPAIVLTNDDPAKTLLDLVENNTFGIDLVRGSRLASPRSDGTRA